ncbi:M56 family metallopeptidase, partial [Flavihumibacter sp. CACIAM 22H1]|uniref:M56 family metallopeptidase n=1 Tax=Flavihumibacter sp. CACIAM 22H1 TaxID=1812911 RepID=UPI000A65B362
QLWMSEKIDCPQIMGWIKPIILLPASALSQLSSAQLEAILIHELAHIKRNDYIWNWIISIIENLLFFNPFVKLFITTIRAEREHACDDFVLQFPFQPQLYAEALLKLEQKRTAREMSLVLAAGGSSRKLLLTRVRRMLNIEHALPIRKGYSSLLFLLALSSSLALLIPNNPVTKQWADQLAEPVAALENKLFQGLNYQSMRWNSTPIYVEAAAKDPVSPTVSQAVQTPSKTSELIDNQDQSIDNQENIESEVIVDNSTNDWVEQLNTGSTAPAALYLAAAPLAAEAKAFTFEKSQKNIDLPAEAATIYMHPYVPRKSFETTVVIDTTPALTKHLQAKTKAQEAALQTQLALDKLNWSRVQEQISKLGTGSSRQELQLVLETELAKLNWEEIQQQSKQLMKKLSQLELEKIQSRQEQTQEILQEKLQVLEELTLELKKTEQSLEQAIQQKEKELKKKQEQLRKKHKIVHI